MAGLVAIFGLLVIAAVCVPWQELLNPEQTLLTFDCPCGAHVAVPPSAAFMFGSVVDDHRAACPGQESVPTRLSDREGYPVTCEEFSNDGRTRRCDRCDWWRTSHRKDITDSANPSTPTIPDQGI